MFRLLTFLLSALFFTILIGSCISEDDECMINEDCGEGFICIDAQCIVDTADSGNTGDSGNSGNSGDTGNTGDTGDTGDTGNTGNSGDSGNSGNTASDPVCGNSVVEEGEDCDDGENNSDTTPDACRTDCTSPKCGDKVIDSTEDCDDGNNDSQDDCTNDCTDAVCGDGILWRTEEFCDDGNEDTTDSCISCNIATCGDGFVYSGHEECDNGAENADNKACKSDCSDNTCGDGDLLEGTEVCDGNTNCSSLGKNYINGVALCSGDCTTLDESGCDHKLPELWIKIYQRGASYSDRMYVDWKAHDGTKCEDAQNSKTCSISPVGELYISGDGSGYRDPNYAYIRDFQIINGTFEAKVNSSYLCEVDKVEVYISGSLVKTIDDNKQCKTSDPNLLIPVVNNAWDTANIRWD